MQRQILYMKCGYVLKGGVMKYLLLASLVMLMNGCSMFKSSASLQQELSLIESELNDINAKISQFGDNVDSEELKDLKAKKQELLTNREAKATEIRDRNRQVEEISKATQKAMDEYAKHQQAKAQKANEEAQLKQQYQQQQLLQEQQLEQQGYKKWQCPTCGKDIFAKPGTVGKCPHCNAGPFQF